MLMLVIPQKSSQLSSDQQYTLSKGKKNPGFFASIATLSGTLKYLIVLSLFTPVTKFWTLQEAFYCNFGWFLFKKNEFVTYVIW